MARLLNKPLARMTRWAKLAHDLFPPVTQPAEQAWPCRTPAKIVWQRFEPDSIDAYCPRCGTTSGPGEVTATGCRLCDGRALAWDRVVRLGTYEPPLAFWVRLFKYHGKWAWGPWLGERLTRVIPASTEPQRMRVVPVPLHWSRQWGRGYNQAELMARAIGQKRGWTVARALRRRPGKPQVLLPASQRRGNVTGKFALRKPAEALEGCDVWLVDDVMTTGSTLHVCARLLQHAGARSVQVAVAAVAQPQQAGHDGQRLADLSDGR